jgi:hypothetical protein
VVTGREAIEGGKEHFMSYLKNQLSAAMWARVQLLWLTMAIAALGMGIFVVWMGGFVKDNVRDELASQQITFAAAENMTDEEKAISGLEENAGKAMTTGDQAKVYSNLILLHMTESAEEAGYPGATYATLGAEQRALRAELATAKESGDQTKIDEAQAKLDAVTALRNTMLTGSNLRASLLSAYGWDNVGFGVRIAGWVIIALGVVFGLLFFFERKRGHLPPVNESVQGASARSGFAAAV